MALSKALSNYYIQLTTLGNFYYKCDKKVFEISNDNFTIRYSNRLNSQSKEPVSQNEVYKKISTNVAMFSPYGDWNITLDGSHALAEERKMLMNLKDSPIDLQLVGKGFYVSNAADICNSDLERIYRLDPSYI